MHDFTAADRAQADQYHAEADRALAILLQQARDAGVTDPVEVWGYVCHDVYEGLRMSGVKAEDLLDHLVSLIGAAAARIMATDTTTEERTEP